MRRRFPLAALGLLLLNGCLLGDIGPGGDGLVTIWNRSQFELLEVRVEGSKTDEAPNLTPDGLPVDGQVVEILPHDALVTVVREKVAGGPPIAITTGRALGVAGGRYTLMVFDTSFRLVREGDWNPPDDGGAGDGGVVSDGGSSGDGGTL